ncbi:hypothetical protein ABE67_12920 [Cytobacillus firmus]|uniref:hypothetical protein n=1 Tax=Cytobacillus firmus TaxID=1399 RepID=UPI0018CEF882|nr:hypothetical protein [Cytobacillus firmus]MBG9450205.1 hypothetical protein [Cytobacillus firmus]
MNEKTPGISSIPGVFYGCFLIIFTELIVAEGAKSSKCIRIFFVRCLLKEAYSKSCGSSGTGETPQTRSVEEAHRPHRGSLSSLERKSTGNIDKRKTTIYTKVDLKVSTH